MSTHKQGGPHLAEHWPSCGYRFLEEEGGHLKVTADFLRHFFGRPELAPVETSCAKERALYEALLEDPLRPVGELEMQEIRDMDARENYRVAVSFRNLLVQQGSIEQAYLALAAGKAGQMTPPALMDLLVQILLVHLLKEQSDPFQWRAAELFFRPQKVSVEEGVLLADAEGLERRRKPGGGGVLDSLIRQAQGRSDLEDTLEVLTRDNAERYWEQGFECILSLNRREPGVAALCRVLESWIGHFHGLETRISWVPEIEGGQWYWHIGLDVDSNRILNALYRGEEVDDEEIGRILALFRLEFGDPGRLREEMAGRPVFLGIAMGKEQLLRLKPQNVLVNLPLRDHPPSTRNP